jgi:hypothetical protein
MGSFYDVLDTMHWVGYEFGRSRITGMLSV